MSPATEVSLLVLRELRRSVRSVKGIVLGVLTLVGAFLVSYLSVALEGAKRQAIESDAAFLELKRRIIEATTHDARLADSLAKSPYTLFVFFQITVWLIPLLVALLGFDAISAELQHRTVRFWTVRVRRASYYVGKFAGIWLLVALVALALNTISGGFAVVRGYATFGELIAWGSRFWLTTVVIAGAWSAIAALVSSVFRTPILALLTTSAAFFVLFGFGTAGAIARSVVATGAGAGAEMRWSEYLYPNAYWIMLVSPEAQKVSLGLAVLIGFVVLATTGGSLLFLRRDV